MPASPVCFLLDNGSLNPEATLSLRRISASLGELTGQEVRPISLLHSSSIDPGLLGGRQAEIFEPALKRSAVRGSHDILVLPLFIGPSLAITDYLPGRIRSIRSKFPELKVRVGPSLACGGISGDRDLLEILRDGVEGVIRDKGLHKPAVILVDHGTPIRTVNAVRQRLREQLATLLDERTSRLTAASMERREGEQYDFNEPLLEKLLDREGYCRGDVVISMLFLLPGMHAGPGGDIETICAEARKRHADLHTHLAPLIGEDKRLLKILEERLQMCLRAAPVA